MKQRRWGRIINVTSIAVKQPVDNLILSNTVRAAVTGFARTLANEVATFGITVNNVMPGYTRTRRIEELARRNAELHGNTSDAELAVWENQIPMRRSGRAARVRRDGGVSRIRPGELYDRCVDPGRWRMDKIAAMTHGGRAAQDVGRR